MTTSQTKTYYGLLGIGGGLLSNTITKTSSYVIDSGSVPDYSILCNFSAAGNITLPIPTLGRTIEIKDIAGNADGYNITVVRYGAENIENVSASYVINAKYESIILESDGYNWWLINKPSAATFTAGGDLTGTATNQKVQSITRTGFTETFPAIQGSKNTQTAVATQYIGYVTYTSGTPTILTIPLATSGTSVALTLYFIGKVAIGSGTYPGLASSYTFQAVYQNISGTVTGSSNDINSVINSLTYSPTFTVSGTNIVVKIASAYNSTDLTVVCDAIFN